MPELDSCLQTLPSRGFVPLEQRNIINILPDAGLFMLSDGSVTYGYSPMKYLDSEIAVENIKAMGSDKYILIAVLIGNRLNKDAKGLYPIGYSLIDSFGGLVNITSSQVPEYVDKIENLDTSDVNVKLHLELRAVNKLNKIYLTGTETGYSATQGFRLSSGEIKYLDNRQKSRFYIYSLTDSDLNKIKDCLDKEYFRATSTLDCEVHWTDRGSGFGYVRSYPQKIIVDGIEQVKIKKYIVYINRNFVLAHSEVFYDIFLHLLIHALGCVGHNEFFKRWVGIINSLDSSLEVLPEDYVKSASPHWSNANSALANIPDTSYSEIVCPNCNRLMSPESSSVYRCTCGNRFDFSML